MNGDVLTYMLNNIWTQVIQVTPMVLGSVLLLLLGWVLGRITKNITKAVLKKLKTDEYFKLGKRLGISEIISTGIAWIIYLAFIGATVDFLKIQTLTMFFNNLVDFIVGLLGGLIVLIIGYTIANYIQKQVKQAKVMYAELLSQVIFFFTLVITIDMAFNIVGLPTQLLDSIVIIIVASIGLGVAIALGLGLKDTINQLAKKHLKK